MIVTYTITPSVNDSQIFTFHYHDVSGHPEEKILIREGENVAIRDFKSTNPHMEHRCICCHVTVSYTFIKNLIDFLERYAISPEYVDLTRRQSEALYRAGKLTHHELIVTYQICDEQIYIIKRREKTNG